MKIRLKKFFQRLIIGIILIPLVLFSIPVSVMAKNGQYASEIKFDGSETELEELKHLLFAKLAYDYLDGYEGKSVKDYVKACPDLYSGEIWKDSGITYDALYSSIVGNWEIYRIYNRNTISGFYGVVFRDGDQIIFAFRGSEMFTDEFALDDSNDWTGTDFKFALLNELSSQFDDVDDCYRDLCTRLRRDGIDGKITFCGHSLGGALVAYASLVTGVYGYSFDGAVGHVIDLILYYDFLDVDDFVGAENMPFCNYTDREGYPVADLIQHTNSGAIYQLDRETNLKDLNEYTLIPKYSTAGSHIIWSCLDYEGNHIFFTETYQAEETGYTYVPETPICLDIKRNIIEAGVEDFPDYLMPESLLSGQDRYDYESLLGSLMGVVENGRVMLASEDGGILRGYDEIGVSSAFGVNVVLYGGGGDDLLYGYAADDVLIGGTGQDILDGNLGNDVYVIDRNPNQITTIYDEGGESSAIVFRNINITRIEQLSADSEGRIALRDGQKIELHIVQEQKNVSLYGYQNGRIYELGTLEEISGVKSETDMEQDSTQYRYLAMLEGVGTFYIYDENGTLLEEISNSYGEDDFRRLTGEYGVAYISSGEENGSILLILNKEYDLTVSNYDKRVNLALAKYSDEAGVIATERKYGRRFEEYKIRFDESSLDDGVAGETSWEDSINAGVEMFLGLFK